jgi:hypothetical protein
MRLLALGAVMAMGGSSMAEEGARRVKFLNYPECVELSNQDTVVVLGHHCGGRVLKYEWKGKEALYLDPKEATWGTPEGVGKTFSSAGRFDIGPEYLVPEREVLWSGEWAAEITGARSARLTSKPDEATGVVLIRDFVLAADSSHLACTQTIRNVSSETKRWCHWSRTFAKGGGIVVLPIESEPRRLPNGYVMYPDRKTISFLPEDPMVRRRGGFLEVLGAPQFAKLGMDVRGGWSAYLMPHDLVFVKRFAVDPERAYNEVAAFNYSVWYPESGKTRAVELEPIGPANEIAPGKSAAFTEHWFLLQEKFPAEGGPLDLDALEGRVQRECVVK